MFDKTIKKLNTANKKIEEKLKNSDAFDSSFLLSEWMGSCHAPFIQWMEIGVILNVDVAKLRNENKTNEEIHSFVLDKLIKKLTSFLDGLKQ